MCVVKTEQGKISREETERVARGSINQAITVPIYHLSSSSISSTRYIDIDTLTYDHSFT